MIPPEKLRIDRFTNMKKDYSTSHLSLSLMDPYIEFITKTGNMISYQEWCEKHNSLTRLGFTTLYQFYLKSI